MCTNLRLLYAMVRCGEGRGGDALAYKPLAQLRPLLTCPSPTGSCTRSYINEQTHTVVQDMIVTPLSSPLPSELPQPGHSADVREPLPSPPLPET